MMTMRTEGMAIAVLSVLIHAPLAAQVPPAWTQVATTGPSARFWQAMAYDSQRGRTVLFGGTSTGVDHFGDTWGWDGTTWTQVTATGPAGRYYHCHGLRQPAWAHRAVRGQGR